MTYATLKLEERDRVAVVTIHRPEKLNALDATVFAELVAAFEGLRNRRDIGAVILTGAGEKAFIAGADIAVLAQCDAAAARENARRGQEFTRLLEKLGKPVIAAINGFALGGGCEIALACDIVIAADTAKFGQPEIKLGVIPGAGGTQRLPRAVGKAKAMDLILTGRMMDTAEAERAGLVSRVVPAAKLLDEALAVANAISEFSAPSVMIAKECVNRAYEMPLAEGILFERRLFHSLFATADQKEGMRAFVEKRTPSFNNR